MKKRPIIAICYDFDGTLSPNTMQEYNFIPKLGIKPKQFWAMVKEKAKREDADEILTYMGLMLDEAGKKGMTVRKSDFKVYGLGIKLFPGVEGWFKRIDQYGKKKGGRIEHYVISSGIKEMIEGTEIKSKFKKIYASFFSYDDYSKAVWPALAINYTTKTQFLFKINKGILDVFDSEKVNTWIPKEQRRVPFERMIFVGDGMTDIPCMKLVKEQGGYSIAVYRSRIHKAHKRSKGLLQRDRVNSIAPADYRDKKTLDIKIKETINKMMADYTLYNQT
jgi:haloacid dehalogenase-like hydrolase